MNRNKVKGVDDIEIKMLSSLEDFGIDKVKRNGKLNIYDNGEIPEEEYIYFFSGAKGSRSK